MTTELQRDAMAGFAASDCSPPSYYQDALVTIYHGDARELLPQIEADFLLTDPPYGTKKYQHDIDGYAVLIPEVLARFQIAAVFGWPEKLIGWCIRNGCTPDEWITWWPTNGALRAFNPFGLGRESESIAAFGQAWKWELLKRECAHESKRLAAANYKSDKKSHAGLKHNGKTSRMGDVWRVAAPGLGFNAKKRLHTNEKPMGVLQLLLDAAPDARVLCDPFCGSGTALCAAKRAGIKSIGIEIDERHCETAARRCASELAMGKAENGGTERPPTESP